MNTEDVIQCPHCMHTIIDTQNYVDPDTMSAEFAMDCPKCEKWFDVDMSTVMYFETNQLDGPPEGYDE